MQISSLLGRVIIYIYIILWIINFYIILSWKYLNIISFIVHEHIVFSNCILI